MTATNPASASSPSAGCNPSSDWRPSCLLFHSAKHFQTDDNPSLSLALDWSAPSSVNVASIEAVLEQALVGEESAHDSDDEYDQAVVYPAKADMALLHCLRSETSQTSDSWSSLLGLLEDNVERAVLRSCIPRPLLATSHHDCSANSVSPFNTKASPSLARSWKRTLHEHSCQDNSEHYVPGVLWVDLRSVADIICDRLRKPINVFYFLQSLLGTRHTASPWCSEETTSDTCLVLLLPGAPKCLLDFRIGDASPSWYLHSILRSDSLQGQPWDIQTTHYDDSVASSPCVLLVYRHLTPRSRLTFQHPSTQQTAPPGTLWETLPDPIAVAMNQSTNGNITPQAQPSMVTRLTSQPFLHALAEYPSLQLLLDNLSVIQQEAMSIKHWTAWPETTHYAQLPNSDATPWTVFPLCYCFPATDETQLKWIQQTSGFVPRTTRLLQQLAPFLRTALFSRLEPEALLQAHTGWQDLANHVIRVHVPLQCPPGDDVCGLWVDGCVKMLREGQLVAFDDSKVHWAFNYSPNCERVVLILDMVRPFHLPSGTAVGGHSEELDGFIQSMGG